MPIEQSALRLRPLSLRLCHIRLIDQILCFSAILRNYTEYWQCRSFMESYSRMYWWVMSDQNMVWAARERSGKWTETVRKSGERERGQNTVFLIHCAQLANKLIDWFIYLFVYLCIYLFTDADGNRVSIAIVRLLILWFVCVSVCLSARLFVCLHDKTKTT